MLFRKIKWVVPAASLILLFVSSCSNQHEQGEVKRVFPEYPVALDSIIRTPQGILHGVELGDKLIDIQAKEQRKPDERDNDYVLYNFSIDSLNSYSVAYTFNADSLTEIEVKIKSTSIDASGMLLESLKNYYRQKYTAPLMDKGIYVFNCFDSKKRNFSISITDNSTASTGIVNLMVYRED